MSVEKLLFTNNTISDITQSEKFPGLVDRAIETLESLLSGEELPVEKRALLAAKILELEKQQANPQTAIQDSDNQACEQELPATWKQWIIENKLRDIPNESLVYTMVQNGIDIHVATQAVNNISAGQDFQQESEAVQRLRKLESILEINRKLAELSPKSGTIERRKRISKEEFLEKYYATNTPVIITDMMSDWPAMSLWTPEFFKSNYGDVQVQIQVGRNDDPDYEINCEQHKRDITLSEYVDMVVNSGESNDYYMVANNGNIEREELKNLFHDFRMPPELLNASDAKGRVFFWFGPAGTVTPIHHDPLNVMMAQVYGRKRWRLISPASTPLVYNDIGVFSRVDLENPDYEKYPLFKQVKVIETVLEPGEIIFVPVGWWHQVKALDVSISLSFTNFAFPNQYNYQNPHITSNQEDGHSTNPEKRDQFQAKTLTNEIVQNTNKSYLIDEVFKNEALVISFGFASWDSPPQFDFYGRLKKLSNLAERPINCVLVRDISNSWYHRGIPGLGNNVDEVAESLAQIIERISPSQVITIGQSMGAYAAIMFGQLLGVDKVIAFGPLSFLDSKSALEIGDTRWLPVMQDLEANPPEASCFDLLQLCQESEHCPDIHIFYGKKSDPEIAEKVNLDHYHATRLSRLPNCSIHAYENSGHAVVQYLIDHDLIDGLLGEAVFCTRPNSSSKLI